MVDGDQILLTQLVSGFLEGLPGRMAALTEAIRAGDRKRTELAAHNLKGVLEALGSRRAHHLLRDLEDRAREGPLPDPGSDLERLERALAEIAAFLSDGTGKERS